MAVPQFEDGDSFINCNFSRIGKDNIVFTAKNLTFTACNLFGCAIPNDAIIVDCSVGEIIEEHLTEKLPDIEQTTNGALTLANSATKEFSASLKSKATSEQLEGLINSTDGYKIKVVG